MWRIGGGAEACPPAREDAVSGVRCEAATSCIGAVLSHIIYSYTWTCDASAHSNLCKPVWPCEAMLRPEPTCRLPHRDDLTSVYAPRNFTRTCEAGAKPATCAKLLLDTSTSTQYLHTTLAHQVPTPLSAHQRPPCFPSPAVTGRSPQGPLPPRPHAPSLCAPQHPCDTCRSRYTSATRWLLRAHPSSRAEEVALLDAGVVQAVPPAPENSTWWNPPPNPPKSPPQRPDLPLNRPLWNPSWAPPTSSLPAGAGKRIRYDYHPMK